MFELAAELISAVDFRHECSGRDLSSIVWSIGKAGETCFGSSAGFLKTQKAV